ncbi:MAG: ankyrin repeat domain-containing protein [Marinicellaceae bacterium]
MKIQFNNLSKKTICISILLIVLMTQGCSNDNNTETQASLTNKTIVAEVDKTDAPAIDMHTAVITNNIEAIKQHIAAGSDLNQKDPFGGSSPLISAALFEKTDIAKLLIDAGADINFTNNDGSTALHTAAFFCRPEIVKLLLANGSDKTIINKMGATAYDSVAGDFKTIKPAYDMLGQSLAPMGLVLDYDQLKKTRPIIAEMLK